LENVLIENGLKDSLPPYHRYSSEFIATSSPFLPRLLTPSSSPLMMLQRSFKIIETKEMSWQYKWHRTKQAKRKRKRQDLQLTMLDTTSSE
jgi:hypothetical protein